ncbi:hypothetical protein ACFXGA_06135 [Actinosynnema sp. NPDC059335]|uniref:hypothetical protein n=1 Tax=Actinosynnema sp. NPDC059335 TaxID=3346804 RepID=UPI003670A9A8
MPSSSRSRHIQVTGLDAWVNGLEKLGTPTQDARETWDRVTQQFFDRTQEHTHIITGRLIASGRYATQRRGDTIEGRITYGGTEEVFYAAYEFGRGGSHDALLLGFLEVQARYARALREIIEDEVRSWR